MPNIWNLFLNTLIWVISNVVAPLFPAADQGPAITFAQPMVSGFVIFLELAYTFFSVFNLYWFGIFLTMVLVLSVYRISMEIFLFIIRVIKAAAVLVGKF